jgi:hypothetical protein
MENNKVKHRDGDFLINKYEKNGFNFCMITLEMPVTANGNTILSARIDSTIKFYPRELRAHAFVTASPSTKGYFKITQIDLGNTKNILYGQGLYSHLFGDSSSVPVPFTGYIPPSRDIRFYVSEINGAASTVAIYLIGEYKPA